MPALPGSPYVEEIHSAAHVKLRDISLRQHYIMDSVLSVDEKLFFLHQLEAIGVTDEVVWGVDPDAEELVIRARDAGLAMKIWFFTKAYYEEDVRSTVERAKRCGAEHVSFVGRAADWALELTGWSWAKMLSACSDGVKTAKDAGLTVSMGLAYATQTDPGRLQEAGIAFEEAGADAYELPDSLGVISPDGIRTMLKAVREATTLPLEVHCHNDFGLAVANSVAAVQAGAEGIECVVNGMDPERCGITALEEVAVALQLLHGVPMGLDLTRLTQLSHDWERMTGMTMGVNKPITGERAFGFRIRPDQELDVMEDPFYGKEGTDPFDPALVGNERRFYVGKYSSSHDLRATLRDEAGLEVPDDAAPALLEFVRQYSAQVKRPVRIDELVSLLRQATAVSGVAAPAGNAV